MGQTSKTLTPIYKPSLASSHVDDPKLSIAPTECPDQNSMHATADWSKSLLFTYDIKKYLESVHQEGT